VLDIAGWQHFGSFRFLNDAQPSGATAKRSVLWLPGPGRIRHRGGSPWILTHRGSDPLGLAQLGPIMARLEPMSTAKLAVWDGEIM